MAIQSKHVSSNTTERLVDMVCNPADQISEFSLRPKRLDEYIGQESIKKHLQVAFESARIRKEPLDHLLFYGPPGLGKTTLAHVIAQEMGVHIRETSGPAIEKQSDLISILTSLEGGDVLFIDEIHRLRPQLEEILYSAMEDFKIDVMIGSGTGATSVRIDIPKFTLVGATTRLSKISSPLRDRFGNVFRLEFYEHDELAHIVKRSFSLLECSELDPDTHYSIALRSRGTPRIANRFVRIVRDYYIVGLKNGSPLNVSDIFGALGVDEKGLDLSDRKFLDILANKFGGRAVGLNTIASVLGEEEDTLEDVIEPYLLKVGFIEKTPRGRMISLEGKAYIMNLGL